MSTQPSERPRLWGNTVFLVAAHIAAAIAIIWSRANPPKWQTLALVLIWYTCSGLSITGGYHRLYTHRSYRCSRTISMFYLLFGAAAVQNSVVTWASDHRRHHAHTDDHRDPYDPRQGFWWSHIGWVMRADPSRDYSNVHDLMANPLVAWQHRMYLPIAVVMAAILPTLMAYSWNDAIGGFVWVACFRVIAQFHLAFAINSVAHRFGTRPYSREISARDNVVLAFLTMGEGYHNFHHRFPSDYRNGPRWFDFDPTKWLISALAAVGLASNLRRASGDAILNARVERARGQ